jgi:hypothetical protein
MKRNQGIYKYLIVCKSAVIILVLLTSTIAHVQSDVLTAKNKSGRIQLIETGDFHGDEMPAKSSNGWLGLYKVGKKIMLLESSVRVELVHDAVVDEDDENAKTGKRVSVNHSTEPIFLIKGAAMLKPGTVTTVLAGEKQLMGEEYLMRGKDLLNKTNFALKLANKEYNLKVIAKKRKANRLGIQEDAQLILTQGTTTQVLDVFGDDTEAMEPYWGVFWAGDLDNDGKLDLYIDVYWRYNTSQHILFLSSQAEQGKLVKSVAQIQTTGC